MHIFVERLLAHSATVSGEDAHHLVNVRRVHVGEVFPLIETEGPDWALGRVSRLSKREVEFTFEEKHPKPAATPPRLILCPALLKRPAMENVLQRAVELGVSAICPIEASRSVPDAGAVNSKRWATIVREAAMQSHRFEIPSISPTCQPQELLLDETSAVIVLTTQSTSINLKSWVDSLQKRPTSIGILVGPEGGWTSAEEALFAKKGWALVSFGASIMRADTATLGVLSALRYAYHTLS